nr:UDP-N-acetylglucosamine 2-epimerase [uncultured Caldimonas sp.]
MKRKLCVVTGSRAEYGLLYWVLREIEASALFDLQLIVTGMHLAPEFGRTVEEIERDGFRIARRVHMLLAGDAAVATAKSVGLGVIAMADALAELQPDMVMILGDRFEILAVAQTCLLLNIPVAHIAGGDTTEGAYDEAIRHAITKMSHLHFVTNTISARRVVQLGEQPERVFVVGSPGLDHLRRTPLLDRHALEQSLGAVLGARNLLVTFHPETLDPGGSERHFSELIAALDEAEADASIWCTKPNADTGGRALAAMVDEWAARRPGHVRAYASLGQVRYLSLMAHMDAVVGNSSSGLYEAPSFRIPTIDIGQRQRGRLAAASVVHCEAERGAIVEALRQARMMDCSTVVNPYGDGRTAERIVEILKEAPPTSQLLKKSFYLLEQ